MSIKSKIQALISAANTKTGESDTTLTDAVQTLVDGYGQGGSGEVLLASGTFTKADGSSALNIPVSYSGTMTAALVKKSEIQEGTAHTAIWAFVSAQSADILEYFSNPFKFARSVLATGQLYWDVSIPIGTSFSPTKIVCGRTSSNYPVLDGTYDWYIWGYAE